MCQYKKEDQLYLGRPKSIDYCIGDVRQGGISPCYTEGEGIPVGIMGFSDLQITDKYIYTVFHGRTFREIGKNIQEGKEKEDGGRFIYVFDLEGKPVVKYTLDRAVYGICVNEEANTIIATDVNSDEPLVRLLLPVGN